MHGVLLALLLTSGGSPVQSETPVQAETPEPTPFPDEVIIRPKISHAAPPAFAPSAGIALSFDYPDPDHGGPTTTSVPVWLGAAFHPAPAAFSPFASLGVAGSIRQQPLTSARYTEVVPEVRLGVSSLSPPFRDFWNLTFPNLEVYGLAGWRLPNIAEGQAARLGLGVSLPLIGLLASGGCQAPFPGMVEVTIDADRLDHGTDRPWSVRLGLEF